MNFKNFNQNDTLYFVIMLLFSLICTVKMADFCMSGGILSPDMSLYSITALKYAGIDYYNIVDPFDIFYTPIISFLTSLLFRIGLVDKSAIIIVTAILGFFGYIGFYFLLKLRFNSMLSLLGIIIYGSTSVIIFNLSKGLIDIPSLSISIWVIYFAIKAIDSNPKYFLIAFPLFVIGFFVKYVSGFVLPAIFAYYLMNRNFVNLMEYLIYDRNSFKNSMKKYLYSSEFKYIIFSISISLILAIIICKTLILDFGGSLIFFEQSVNTFNGNNKHAVSNILNLDKSYYIDNFSYFLFERQGIRLYLADLLYGILSCALILKAYNFIKNFNYFKSQKKSFKNSFFEKLLIILLILGICISFYGFKELENNMVSNIALIFSIVIFYALLVKFPLNKKEVSLNLLVITYFMVNLVFVSLYPHKTFRYALPLLPPFIYAIIWALDYIFRVISDGFDSRNPFNTKINLNIKYSNVSNIIYIVLIAIFLISTFSFIMPLEFNRTNDVYQEVLYCGYATDLDDACDFITYYDSDYHSKSFASFIHSSRMIRWNLNVNVTMIDEKDSNLQLFNETDYLILYKDIELDNYYKIHDCGDFHIYYHK